MTSLAPASKAPASASGPPSTANLQSPRPTPSPGLRVAPNRKTIYDRNLNRTRNAELSRASFAYLFSEMISYAQRRVTGIQDLERRLNEQGYPLGLRLLALSHYRLPPRHAERSTRILPLLQFIHTSLWKQLFGRPADALERSSGNELEYMISDNEPLVNQYISVPKEMSQLNCGAFVAGIIEGVCDGGGMAAKVSAHGVGTDMWVGKTVWLVRFEEEVVEREAIVEKAKGSG